MICRRDGCEPCDSAERRRSDSAQCGRRCSRIASVAVIERRDRAEPTSRSTTTTTTPHRPGHAAPPSLVRAGRRHRASSRSRGSADRGRPSRIVQVAVTGLSLVITTVVMMNVVHFNPINASADLDLRPDDADRRRHGRPRVGSGLPPRPPAAELPAVGLEHGLVRRHARLPLLHGGPGAGDRRPRHGLRLRRGVQAGRDLRAGEPAAVLLGVRPPGPLPLPDAGAVRLRRACASPSTRASASTAAT